MVVRQLEVLHKRLPRTVYHAAESGAVGNILDNYTLILGHAACIGVLGAERIELGADASVERRHFPSLLPEPRVFRHEDTHRKRASRSPWDLTELAPEEP